MSRTKAKLGDWNAECDVCGFYFKASKLNKRWDGLFVCRKDYEKRHPSDLFRMPKEDTTVPWIRNSDGQDEALTRYVAEEGGSLGSGLYIDDFYVELG